MSTHPPVAIAGASIHFTVGAQSCDGVTNASGIAACGITPPSAGNFTLTASYAGDPQHLPASAAAIAAAAGTAKVELRNSTLSGNIGVALALGPAVSATVASVVGSLLSANGTGIQAQGAGNSAYVSDTTITRNATGVAASGAMIVSAGDNRLADNTTDGSFSSTLPKQ